MMRLTYILIAAVLAVPVANAVSIAPECRSAYQEGRWIDTYDCLNRLLIRVPDSRPVEENIREFESDVIRLKKALPGGDKTAWYEEGWLSWTNLDLAGAYNNWVRYEAWTRLDQAETSSPRLKEVRRFLSFIRSIRNDSSDRKIDPLPAVSAPKPKPARSANKEIIQKTVTPIQAEPFVRSMVEKAVLAEQNGQLEMALKLYLLALRASPESNQIRTKIDYLRNLMN